MNYDSVMTTTIINGCYALKFQADSVSIISLIMWTDKEGTDDVDEIVLRNTDVSLINADKYQSGLKSKKIWKKAFDKMIRVLCMKHFKHQLIRLKPCFSN